MTNTILWILSCVDRTLPPLTHKHITTSLGHHEDAKQDGGSSKGVRDNSATGRSSLFLRFIHLGFIVIIFVVFMIVVFMIVVVV